MKLNFKATLAEHEIVGRLLGPDLADGYAVAVGVHPLADGRTEVRCRPALPSELRAEIAQVEIDDFGQAWMKGERL